MSREQFMCHTKLKSSTRGNIVQLNASGEARCSTEHDCPCLYVGQCQIRSGPHLYIHNIFQWMHESGNITLLLYFLFLKCGYASQANVNSPSVCSKQADKGKRKLTFCRCTATWMYLDTHTHTLWDCVLEINQLWICTDWLLHLMFIISSQLLRSSAHTSTEMVPTPQL